MIAQAEVATPTPQQETILDPMTVLTTIPEPPSIPVVLQQQQQQQLSKDPPQPQQQQQLRSNSIVTNGKAASHKISHSNHNITDAMASMPAGNRSSSYTVSTIAGSRVSFSDLTSVSGTGVVGSGSGLYAAADVKRGLSSSGSGYFGTSSTWDGPMTSNVIKNSLMNSYVGDDDEDVDYDLDDDEEWSS